VANDFNEGPDIFRVDITTSDIERVSVGLNGEEAVSVDGSLSISGDGMVITFGSPADNLVANDTNLTSDIFIRDLTL
jgi:Tol biopolymer transport system component